MALQSLACEKCGKLSDVDVPDDGSATVWECTDHECSARNKVGTDAVSETEEAQAVEGIISISEADGGTAGDLH